MTENDAIKELEAQLTRLKAALLRLRFIVIEILRRQPQRFSRRHLLALGALPGPARLRSARRRGPRWI